MRFHHFFPLSALAFTLVRSVTYSDFPQCAQECLSSTAAQTGSSTDDLNFICHSPAFFTPLQVCETKACSPSDMSRIFTIAIQFCEPVGGTITASLANLSSCAQPGLDIATAESGCSITDWTCICTNPAYTIIAAEFERQYCSPADRQDLVDYTSAACAAVGVELQPLSDVFSASSPVTPTSSAQSVYDLPQCAQPCVDAALLQSGCQPSDWDCICINPAFTSGEAAFCELQACSVEDQYGILNITNARCSAIGEALVPATTISGAPGAGQTASGPLEAATVPLVFPTGSVKGSVPQFSNIPDCTQFCAINATTKYGYSVADLEVLCKDGPVLESIEACNSALCSATDKETTLVLNGKLCEPVEGPAYINPPAQSIQASVAYPTTTAVATLNDVPSCAKPCLVTAFRESGCALDDVQCQCTSSAFANLFADCQAAVCGILDLQSLLPFTIKRCASVGIAIPPSRVSLESKVAYAIPTSTDSFPVPTDLTNAPNDVADLPACGQKCIYNAASFAGCDIHNLTCICASEDFMAFVGTCETGACTADELQVISAFGTALCLPVPGQITVRPSGSLLSSYLASPTYSAPNPPSITNTPYNITALPTCAQNCIYSSAAKANCSSVNDLTCICKNPTFLSSVGSCEQSNCTSAELEVIIPFSQKLCALAGGINPAFTSNATVPSSTGRVPPAATPFTGKAATLKLPVLDYVVGVLVFVIWTM